MSQPYVPILFMLALGFGFAALSVGTSMRRRAQELQPRQARGL